MILPSLIKGSIRELMTPSKELLNDPFGDVEWKIVPGFLILLGGYVPLLPNRFGTSGIDEIIAFGRKDKDGHFRRPIGNAKECGG
jgi:hypothetical protein